MAVRKKWWPLPSHAPIHTSNFSFPEVATVKMIFANADSQPTSETVWIKPWNVTLSERIASRDKWHSIIEKFGYPHFRRLRRKYSGGPQRVSGRLNRQV